MLIDIAQALDRFGSFAYVRPYAEMNGQWNPYCAYNSNGSYRGAAHSTKNFRKAFRRTYLIVHGGSVARHQRQARRLGHAEAQPDERPPA